MILLENVNKVFKSKNNEDLVIFENLSLEINNRDFISIVGTSGVGKTTLLNIIGLLDDKYDGEYSFNNMKVSEMSDRELSDLRNKYIGYVFQDYKLIDEFSVYENIEVSLLINKSISHGNIDRRIKESIRKVNLDLSMLKKKVSKLSGGEKQRVAIARAIAKEPILIIADEPTGAIDEDNKDAIMDLLVNLNKEGKTLVLVSHDMEVASKAQTVYKILDKNIQKLEQTEKY